MYQIMICLRIVSVLSLMLSGQHIVIIIVLNYPVVV